MACLGFYVDAVPYSKRDSFYAFYWNGAFSVQRRVITTIRKSDLCRCGCRGLCSVNGIMRVIVCRRVIVVMFAVRLMGVPVLMLTVVSMIALVLMITMTCMGLLVFVLVPMPMPMPVPVLVVMHGFMKLVVDHLERYRIDDRKNACGHCSVKSSRFNGGCGNAIAKQRHGLIECCGSSRM